MQCCSCGFTASLSQAQPAGLAFGERLDSFDACTCETSRFRRMIDFMIDFMILDGLRQAWLAQQEEGESLTGSLLT